MSEGTVNVDGQDYIFDPDEVTKPEKQENQEEDLLWDSNKGGLQK